MATRTQLVDVTDELDRIMDAVLSKRVNPRIAAIDEKHTKANAELARRVNFLEVAIAKFIPTVAQVEAENTLQPAAKLPMKVQVQPRSPRPKAAPKAQPKARPTSKKSTAAQREEARVAAGAKLGKCPACKGTGIWGTKKNGEQGQCFDCFGRGKMSLARKSELAERRK